MSSSDPDFLIQVFYKEFVAQVDILSDGIKLLVSGTYDDSLIETVIKASHEMKGGAKIVHIEPLSQLAKTVEDYFITLQRKQCTCDLEHQTVLLNILKYLKALAAKKAQEVSETVNEQAPQINALTDSIRKLSHKVGIKEDEASYIDESIWQLFRAELEDQIHILNQGLIDFEQKESNSETLEGLMRSAHSIKGAAKVMQLDSIVHLAHAIEECLVRAQEMKVHLDSDRIDMILNGVDFLTQLTHLSSNEILLKLKEGQRAIDELIESIQTNGTLKKQKKEQKIAPSKTNHSESSIAQDRILRVSAQSLNRLMGLAGESLVESRWLQPFGNSLIKIKKNLNDASRYLDNLREFLESKTMHERIEYYLVEAQHKTNQSIQNLNDRMAELEMFIRRHSSLSDRLYREVIDSRMRPLADGVEGFPRMVRDLSRELKKKVHFEIKGKNTPVDREILEKLEAPLSHLIRNAIDHGIESSEERTQAGKLPEGTVTLEAQHRSGMLSISVEDDGRGLNFEALRKKVIDLNLAPAETAKHFSDIELLDFLFLPGITTANEVTEISGRGVGLNIVQVMLQEVGGTIRVYSEPGKGVCFNLILPLTLSVIRALIVEISGESYAFPLARIDRTLAISSDDIEIIENRQYIKVLGQNIGIVAASQVIESKEVKFSSPEVYIIVLSDHLNSYGIVVDKFLGERELVVQELDSRLGKIPDISAGALMEDGMPVLIIDIDDMVRSIDNLLLKGAIHKIAYSLGTAEIKKKKRILVIDDSITVREVESRILQNQGYEVQTAINGIDGWNALQTSKFDLVITDVDMPRMNGIELVKMIRSAPIFNDLYILMVSYKERDEDRLTGLEAGANYYLKKSSFHDETLIKAVTSLIGAAS